MKEITDRELQWLEAFAKKHEFFASFLLHYKLKYYLENNQYYWFHLNINQAEDQGDTLLDTSEIGFLEEFSPRNENLREIFSSYEDKGYLDKEKYEELLNLKADIMGSQKKVKAQESFFKHKVVKLPCPHCSFLCSPQIMFCSKCGEPLPKLEKTKEFAGTSEISDEDYAEKNIIHSLEKLIDKPIPLSEEFNRSSTCYIKEGDEITGLSIYNCGIKAFPHGILRLKFLRHLALRRNNLEYLPKEIGFLSNLEYLDLRLNKLEKLPNAIGLLFKLKNLNLSSNILITIPDSIGDLLMLKTLNLKSNHWITIPENVKKLESEGLELIL